MGAKQYLIDSLNADTIKAGNLKIEDYKKAATEKYAPDKKAEEDFINSTYDKAAANVQAVNDKKLSDTNTEYANQYERNAVQKLINEKKIAEKMANLGLTDSGLNRTQQTAVQLGYANQKGKIDMAKQSTIDNLALNLTSALTEIETNRSSALLATDQKWKDKAYLEAQTNYNNDLNAINERITSAYKAYGDIVKAETEAVAKAPKVAYGAGGTSTGGYIVSSETGTLSRDYMGSLKDNGVSTVYKYNDDGSIKSVTYTDSNSGISASFDAGVNPYTGRMHKDVRDEHGLYDPTKAFDNGYQPNNINGIKLELEENDAINVNGQAQKVFKCENKYYTWDGKHNEYFEVVRVELSNATHKWEQKK